jgi:hypothetical protein
MVRKVRQQKRKLLTFVDTFCTEFYRNRIKNTEDANGAVFTPRVKCDVHATDFHETHQLLNGSTRRFFCIEFRPNRSRVATSTGTNSFTPYVRPDSHFPVLMKLAVPRQPFLKTHCTEFHENLTNGLVGDVGLQAERRTSSPHKTFSLV